MVGIFTWAAHDARWVSLLRAANRATCEAIEALDAWAHAQAAPEQAQFMWEGANYLLRTPLGEYTTERHGAYRVACASCRSRSAFCRGLRFSHEGGLKRMRGSRAGLPSPSGMPRSISRSKRPKRRRAASIVFGLFVAPMTTV